MMPTWFIAISLAEHPETNRVHNYDTYVPIAYRLGSDPATLVILGTDLTTYTAMSTAVAGAVLALVLSVAKAAAATTIAPVAVKS